MEVNPPGVAHVCTVNVLVELVVAVATTVVSVPVILVMFVVMMLVEIRENPAVV